jgi:hypothetical protein
VTISTTQAFARLEGSCERGRHRLQCSSFFINVSLLLRDGCIIPHLQALLDRLASVKMLTAMGHSLGSIPGYTMVYHDIYDIYIYIHTVDILWYMYTIIIHHPYPFVICAVPDNGRRGDTKHMMYLRGRLEDLCPSVRAEAVKGIASLAPLDQGLLSLDAALWHCGSSISLKGTQIIRS